MPEINAIIREPSGVSRTRWPTTTGLPFAQGALRDPTRIALADSTGQILPACASALATWPDGSIKWALLDAQIDIGPMARAAYRIYADPQRDPAALRTPLACECAEKTIAIDTGPLAVRLNRGGPRLITALALAGRSLLGEDAIADFIAFDLAGTGYPGQVESAAIEEQNPLRLVVKVEGSFVAADGARLMGWQARLYFYAHQPFFKVLHTFVHDQPAPIVQLSRLHFALPLALTAEKRFMLGSRNADFGHGEDPRQLDHPLTLIQTQIERHALLGKERSDHRVNTHGWVHLADGQTGATLKLRHPWQNYPKAFAISDDGLALDLYPDLRDFAPPAGEPGRTAREMDHPDSVDYVGPLRIPQGMAKTHEFFVHLGDPGPSARHIDALCLAFEEPLLLQLPSEHYATTGALGPFHPFDERHWPLEHALRRACRPPNGLGLLNYGDQVLLEREGQQCKTRTCENLAADLPRSLLRQYLRAGDQRLFREAEAAIHHLIDIDTVHYSSDHPEWIGGPHRQHAQNHHWTDTDENALQGPATSHAWVGSLLDYYFLTGYPRARETAEACADFCRRQAPYGWKSQIANAEADQAWPFNTPVAGQALIAMGTYYSAFRDERFLRAMETLVDLFEAWQDADGRWRDPIGSFNHGAVPTATASVLQGLQQYYQDTGDIRAHRLLLDGARFLTAEGRTAEGLFYHQERPNADRPHPATQLLPPLAFVYRETGDAQILDAGYRLFRDLVDSRRVTTRMLADLFAFMPLLGDQDLLADYEGPDLTGSAPICPRS